MKVIFIAVICTSLSGCLVPAITGLKEIKQDEKGNTSYSFITGADIGFSLNGIDTVKNSRGIAPNAK